MKHVSFNLWALGVLLLAGQSWAQSQVALPGQQAGPFEVRAFHLPIRQFKSEKYYQEIIDDIAARDYNMVIFQLSGIHTGGYTVPDVGKLSFNGWSSEQMKQLIAYARSHRLEPVFDINIISKLAVIMPKLAEKYPGVLQSIKGRTHGIVDMNYRFKDGRDAYDAVVLPMIDGVIDLYGDQPPKYILLSNDEIPVGDLQSLGDKMGLDAAQYMAKCTNRCTEHVLAKNITPILWGDMYLSPKLAGPNSGVKGFEGDPRFAEGGADHYHAEYYQNAQISVVSAMNDLKHRDRIIMAHWFYWPRKDGEFPAIDYFQEMGFKDVWGCTWFNEWTMRHLSQYVAKRKGGGMMATSWNIAFSSDQSYRLKPIIDNSAVYFKNPDFQPPSNTEEVLLGGKSMPWSIKPGVSLTIRVTLPESVTDISDALFWLTSGLKKKPIIRMPLVWDKKTHTLTGTAQIPSDCKIGSLFDAGVRYTDAHTGYTKQIYRKDVVAIAQRELPTASSNEGWLNIDFSLLGDEPVGSTMLRIPGEYGGWLQLAESSSNRFDRSSYMTPPLELWKRMADEGFSLTMECKVTEPYPLNDPLAEKAKPYTALLTFGSYNQGFRLLYNRNGDLLLQFGNTRNDGKPSNVTFPKALSMGIWARVTITLDPVDTQPHPLITLSVDGKKPVSIGLETFARISALPLTLGSEFRVPSTERTMPDFPGEIKGLIIGPLQKTQESATELP